MAAPAPTTAAAPPVVLNPHAFDATHDSAQHSAWLCFWYDYAEFTVFRFITGAGRDVPCHDGSKAPRFSAETELSAITHTQLPRQLFVCHLRDCVRHLYALPLARVHLTARK